MPKPYPKEFREDVVGVAQNRDEHTTMGQVAKDFGLHEDTLRKWQLQTDLDEVPARQRSGRRGHGSTKLLLPDVGDAETLDFTVFLVLGREVESAV